MFRVAAGARARASSAWRSRPTRASPATCSRPASRSLVDVARTRFGAAAEQTGYVPRSVVAVPLLDDEGSIGVLEVLDKRSARASTCATSSWPRSSPGRRRSRSGRRGSSGTPRPCCVGAHGARDDEASVEAVVADAVATLVEGTTTTRCGPSPTRSPASGPPTRPSSTSLGTCSRCSSGVRSGLASPEGATSDERPRGAAGLERPVCGGPAGGP